MEKIIPIIIWVGIVLVIRGLAAKKSPKKDRPMSPRRRHVDYSEADLPPDLLELLKKVDQMDEPTPKPTVPRVMPRANAQTQSRVQTRTGAQAKPRQAVPAEPSKSSHAGESYASPIPDPYASPMIGKETPSRQHAESHIGPVRVKDHLKEHGASAVAKHADAHIATTQAVPTPQSGDSRKKSPLADWIPRGERGLRKALVMSEIMGAPKSLR